MYQGLVLRSRNFDVFIRNRAIWFDKEGRIKLNLDFKGRANVTQEASLKNFLVYLALGGNEADSLIRLKTVKSLLSLNKNLRHLRFSHFYQTSPVDMESDALFVNAVCSFETNLTLNELFEMVQLIEKCTGKLPKPKNASRPVDLDILFYGSMTLQDSALKIPHERWKERLFVLVPLADLAKEIIIETEEIVTVYNLDFLIKRLKNDSPQMISLLEENSDIQ